MSEKIAGGVTSSARRFAPATAHGVDVVDADLKGRAFPRLDQSSLVAAGPPPLLGPQIGGTTIAVGTVTEVLRQSAESASGFGSVWITDQPSGAEVRIEMESEFLHALVDGKPVAATPDIIVVVDRRASSIVRCDDLRNGMLVEVTRLDPPAFWQDPDRRAFLTASAIGSRWPDE